MKKTIFEYFIYPLTSDDILPVAQLHQQELSGLLSQFKEEFLGHFYHNTLVVPGVFTLVARENGNIRGFVSGTTRMKGLLPTVLMKEPLWYSLFFMRYFITHASKIIPAIQTLLYPGFSGQEPELLSLAVKKDQRGKGVGKKLFLVCAEEFKQRGHRSFLISAYDRLPANGFYKRMGCERIRSFEFHGERMNYYRYRIK